jgi:DNA-binding transcriptional MerR regulator
MVQDQALRIGELARRTGLRTSAVRYYERRGILPRPHRLPNGHRVYGKDALPYLRLIRGAQALGITLRDVGRLVQLVSCGQPPCEQVHALVEAKLGQVEKTIRELETLRVQLKRAATATRPGRCPATDLCPCEDQRRCLPVVARQPNRP